MRHGWRTCTTVRPMAGPRRVTGVLLAGALHTGFTALGGQSPEIHSPVQALAAGIVTSARPAAASTPSGAPIPRAAPAQASAQQPSHTALNYGSWGAGYVADAPDGRTFTEVSTRFSAPAAATAPQSPGGGWVSIWDGIGLDAAHGAQLMQVGISMHASPAGVWDVNTPWWINEPTTPTVPNVLYMTVQPGDVLQVDAKRVDESHWTFQITDVTSGATRSGECSSCQSDGGTAAWIVEDPLSSTGSGQTGFADPGQVQFISAAAALDGGSLTPLPQLDWHPLLRLAGTDRQGPLATEGPAVTGGFTVGNVA